MKNYILRNIIENKYSHLMISIILLFLLAPFMEKVIAIFPITHLILFMIIMLTLRVLKVKKGVYIIVICLGLLAVLLEYLVNEGVFSEYNRNALTVLFSTYILFIGTAIVFLIKNVFTEKAVTGDTIRGGITIYFLLGFWWVFIYYLVLTLNPGALVSTVGDKLNLVRLYQYSFAMLTTVGYGETIPKSEFAITLSNFEAISGQIYLTVFIARLVGMYLVRKITKSS